MIALRLIHGGRTLDLRDVIPSVVRRPCDVRDPDVIAITPQLEDLASHSRRLGFELTTILPLLWERTNLLAMLASVGLPVDDLRANLTVAAGSERPEPGIAPLDAQYLRFLKNPRERSDRHEETSITVAVPRRIGLARQERCEGEDWSQAVSEAVAWESAAVCVSLTMTEWALYQAVAKCQSALPVPSAP